MKVLNLVSMLLLFIVMSCSTTGKFKVPAGSKLYIEGQALNEAQMSEYKRNPFFWDVAKGIPYRIEKDGKLIDQGKLRSQFRPVSIIWPPVVGFIIWPLGFRKDGYDFTSKSDWKVRPDDSFVDAPHRK